MQWTDMFEIKYDTESSGVNNVHFPVKFHIVDKSTGNIVGSYDDHQYAIKQAKHKFKRYIKKIERMLLG